ncbi:hypothetical protein G9A89_011142 [Geosiphon pyriformis]|nr:hypothetical protein G9A89_011142 [Geosiphon pyriformis]
MSKDHYLHPTIHKPMDLAYTLLSTLEEKQQIAATHIKHSQAQQKERHNDKLPPVTNEFKIENKVLLYRTKAEKQWSGKFENK